MRAPARVARLRRLSWTDRALLVEAWAWLGVARLAVLVVPFRRLAPRLGEAMAETPSDAPVELAGRVAGAVRTASRVTPWNTSCLAEAIAAQRMLRRRHIPSTIYLGLTKDGKAMAAHAWLRCGDQTLTGEAVKDRFTPVATFAQTG